MNTSYTLYSAGQYSLSVKTVNRFDLRKTCILVQVAKQCRWGGGGYKSELTVFGKVDGILFSSYFHIMYVNVVFNSTVVSLLFQKHHLLSEIEFAFSFSLSAVLDMFMFHNFTKL